MNVVDVLEQLARSVNPSEIAEIFKQLDYNSQKIYLSNDVVKLKAFLGKGRMYADEVAVFRSS